MLVCISIEKQDVSLYEAWFHKKGVLLKEDLHEFSKKKGGGVFLESLIHDSQLSFNHVIVFLHIL